MKRNQITNVVLEGVDLNDRPDFTDAYIQSADYKGAPMSEEQLEEINEDCDFIHDTITI